MRVIDSDSDNNSNNSNSKDTPLHFHKGTSGPLIFDENVGQDFKDALIKSGLEVHLYLKAEMKGVMYGKLLLNLINAIGGVCINCMYVCMHVCKYVSMYVCMYVCVNCFLVLVRFITIIVPFKSTFIKC